MRHHYALTLRDWCRNLVDHWDEAVEEVGLPTAKVWGLYMAGSRLGFETNVVQLHQVLAVKLDSHGGDGGLPLRPWWTALESASDPFPARRSFPRSSADSLARRGLAAYPASRVSPRVRRRGGDLHRGASDHCRRSFSRWRADTHRPSSAVSGWSARPCRTDPGLTASTHRTGACRGVGSSIAATVVVWLVTALATVLLRCWSTVRSTWPPATWLLTSRQARSKAVMHLPQLSAKSVECVGG